MSNEFTGKTAIISGAGGIGLARRALARQGMNIVMGDIDNVTESGNDLREKGFDVLTCALDVTDYAQWEDIVANAKEKFGKVHMVINNAGVGGTPGKVEDSEHETWRWVMDVNVSGAIYAHKHACQLLKSTAKEAGC